MPDSAVFDKVRSRFRADSTAGSTAEARISTLVMEEAPLAGATERSVLEQRLTSELLGLGALEALLEDPAVSDVLVNGPGTVWVERNGELMATQVVITSEEIHTAIERLIAPLGLRCDRSHPITDGRLSDGTRVTAVLDPIAVAGPLLALRRHSAVLVSLASFGDAPIRELLRRAVAKKLNIVVYGATGSGKTTLLNSLSGELSDSERLVVIEDVAELRLEGKQTVRLETRAPTESGGGGVSMRDLVRTALRLRPDRLIVGEVRGPEALEMLWALSSGHRGSMSTCHALDAQGAVSRLETMVIMATGEAIPVSSARSQILDAIDLFVGVARQPDGSRKVCDIHASTSEGLRNWLDPNEAQC